MKSTKLIFAPMAGGMSNPQLCAEVARESALPFLAACFLTIRVLQAQIEHFEQLSDAEYGINIFFYPPSNADLEGTYLRYRDILIRASSTESDLPEQPCWDDDVYKVKINLALASKATYVSITFGHPD